jgi:hypothetical protein
VNGDDGRGFTNGVIVIGRRELIATREQDNGDKC